MPVEKDSRKDEKWHPTKPILASEEEASRKKGPAKTVPNKVNHLKRR